MKYMAKARCYTKSGNVEKYESKCFSGTVLHRPIVFKAELVGPNSDGNYTITYEGYDDGNSSNYDCYCKTIYGPDWRHNKGEIKTFYFIKRKIKITFRLSNLFTNGNGTVTCSISGQLPTDIYFGICHADDRGGFTIFGNKTNSGKGFFNFQFTSPYPNEMPKVGQQWALLSVSPEPFGTDLGDFEYVPDTTPFTIKS